jgi:hypothetical protein
LWHLTAAISADNWFASFTSEAANMDQEQSKKYLKTAKVRARYGDASIMSLWRWQQSLGFPKPALVINGYNLWDEADLDEWDAAQAQKSPAPGAECLSRGRRQPKIDKAAA